MEEQHRERECEVMQNYTSTVVRFFNSFNLRNDESPLINCGTVTAKAQSENWTDKFIVKKTIDLPCALFSIFSCVFIQTE